MTKSYTRLLSLKERTYIECLLNERLPDGVIGKLGNTSNPVVIARMLNHRYGYQGTINRVKPSDISRYISETNQERDKREFLKKTNAERARSVIRHNTANHTPFITDDLDMIVTGYNEGIKAEEVAYRIIDKRYREASLSKKEDILEKVYLQFDSFKKAHASSKRDY